MFHSSLLLIYLLWLCCVCVASWLFSSCGKQGPLSSCGAQASPCRGFSCSRARAFRNSAFSSRGSWAPERKSTGSIVLAHRLSCSLACGIFPDRTHVSCIGRQILYHWATREAQLCVYPHFIVTFSFHFPDQVSLRMFIKWAAKSSSEILSQSSI